MARCNGLPGDLQDDRAGVPVAGAELVVAVASCREAVKRAPAVQQLWHQLSRAELTHRRALEQTGDAGGAATFGADQLIRIKFASNGMCGAAVMCRSAGG